MFTPSNKIKSFGDLIAFYPIFYRHFIDLNVMPVTIDFWHLYQSISTKLLVMFLICWCFLFDLTTI